MIDFHTHCLPKLDDGSVSGQMTSEIFAAFKAQGVETVIATPHYTGYPESIEHFIGRREESYKRALKELPEGLKLVLGAEVLIKEGMAKDENFPLLAIENTKYFLAEFPFEEYQDWMLEEIYNIIYKFKLYPIFAHIERYPFFRDPVIMDSICSVECSVLQLTSGNIGSFYNKRKLKRMIYDGLPVVFGSDVHDNNKRPPNYADGIKTLGKIFDADMVSSIMKVGYDILDGKVFEGL